MALFEDRSIIRRPHAYQRGPHGTDHVGTGNPPGASAVDGRTAEIIPHHHLFDRIPRNAQIGLRIMPGRQQATVAAKVECSAVLQLQAGSRLGTFRREHAADRAVVGRAEPQGAVGAQGFQRRRRSGDGFFSAVVRSGGTQKRHRQRNNQKTDHQQRSTVFAILLNHDHLSLGIGFRWEPVRYHFSDSVISEAGISRRTRLELCRNVPFFGRIFKIQSKKCLPLDCPMVLWRVSGSTVTERKGMSMPPTTDYDTMAMFLLGLMGTAHCLGMCGPLVVAIPGQVGHWRAHLSYHLGRLITYTAMGACLGGIGGGLARLAAVNAGQVLGWTARLQLLMSALSALFLLVLGLHRLGFVREPRWLTSATLQKIPVLGGAVRHALHRRNTAAVFFLGLMLGLLPCGLSYAAFARTLASGAMFAGAKLSLAFGLGTLPGLVALGTGAGALLRRYRRQGELLAGLIMIGMAVSLAVDLWTAT
jgi:uncharacterized protein